ncbi:MAG: hypothetical protein ACFE0O_14760 [Opitutales bacterium]
MPKPIAITFFHFFLVVTFVSGSAPKIYINDLEILERFSITASGTKINIKGTVSYLKRGGLAEDVCSLILDVVHGDKSISIEHKFYVSGETYRRAGNRYEITPDLGVMIKALTDYKNLNKNNEGYSFSTKPGAIVNQNMFQGIGVLVGPGHALTDIAGETFQKWRKLLESDLGIDLLYLQIRIKKPLQDVEQNGFFDFKVQASHSGQT